MMMDSSSFSVVGTSGACNNALLTLSLSPSLSLYPSSSSSAWKRRVGRSAFFLMTSETGSGLRSSLSSSSSSSSSSSLGEKKGLWSPEMGGGLLGMRAMAIRQVVSLVRARAASESHRQHQQDTSPSKINAPTISLIFSTFSIFNFILDIIGWIISFPGSLLRFLKKEEKLLDEIEEDIIEGVELVKIGAKVVEKFADEIEAIARKAEDIADKVEEKTKSIHDEVEEAVDTVEESLEVASKITGKHIVLGEETKSKIATIKEKVTELEERQSKSFEPATTPKAPDTSSRSSSSVMYDGWKALPNLIMMMQRLRSLLYVKESFLLAFRAFIVALAFVMLLTKNVPELVQLFI